jgi:hypothetical protein
MIGSGVMVVPTVHPWEVMMGIMNPYVKDPYELLSYRKSFPDYLIEIYPQPCSFAEFLREEHRAIVDSWYRNLAYNFKSKDSDVERLHKADILAGYLVAEDGSEKYYSDFTEYKLSRKGYKHFIKKYSFNKLYGHFKKMHPKFVRDYQLSKMGFFKRLFTVRIPNLLRPLKEKLDYIIDVILLGD